MLRGTALGTCDNMGVDSLKGHTGQTGARVTYLVGVRLRSRQPAPSASSASVLKQKEQSC